MSDTGRRSMVDSTMDAMKPDSQKGTLEKAGDKMASAMDSGAAALQPNSQKSASQKMSDGMMSGKGNSEGNKTMLDKAKNAVGMGNNNNNN